MSFHSEPLSKTRYSHYTIHTYGGIELNGPSRHRRTKKRKTNNNNRKFIFSNGVLCDLKRVICVVVVLVCFYGLVASSDNIFCQLPAETMYDGWRRFFSALMYSPVHRHPSHLCVSYSRPFISTRTQSERDRMRAGGGRGRGRERECYT